MRRQLTLAALAAFILAAPVSAQQIVIQNRSMLAADTKNEIRVGVSMNFFVVTANDDSKATVAAQEQARRVLYDSAAHECELLRASLASECRLETINVSVSVQRSYSKQQPEGFTASGNFAFKIKLK
jgi:hypothetical protein